jgi:hypothetical protein
LCGNFVLPEFANRVPFFPFEFATVTVPDPVIWIIEKRNSTQLILMQLGGILLLQLKAAHF